MLMTSKLGLAVLVAMTFSLGSLTAHANDIQANNGGTAHPVDANSILLQGHAAVALYNALAMPPLENEKGFVMMAGGALNCKRLLPTGAICVIGDILGAGVSKDSVAAFDANKNEVEITGVVFSGEFANALYQRLNAEAMELPGSTGLVKRVPLSEDKSLWPMKTPGLLCQQLAPGHVECDLRVKTP